MTGLARRYLHPKPTQRLFKLFFEFGVELFQQFALLVVDQRRGLVVGHPNGQCAILDVAAPAAGVQRGRQQSAQALRHGQLQAYPGK